MKVKHKIIIFALSSVLVGGGLFYFENIYAYNQLNSIIQKDNFSISQDKSDINYVLKKQLPETRNFIKTQNSSSLKNSLAKGDSSISPEKYGVGYKVYLLKPNGLAMYIKNRNFSDTISKDFM